MTSKKEFQTGKTKGIRIANLDDLVYYTGKKRQCLSDTE